jgi:hypothetical protein
MATPNLNIKKLAKGMSLEDKAQLLFADHNKQAETAGVERILAPDEEQAIIDDARKLDQIDELNRLVGLFNFASLILLDIQTAYLNFGIALSKLEGFIMASAVRGKAGDIIHELIYELATAGYSEKEQDRGDIQKKIDTKAQELNEKYSTVNKFLELYDHFTPPAKAVSYFHSELKNKDIEPNKHLQHFFMQTIQMLKDFRRVVYQLDYIVKLAKIDFLGDADRKKLKEYEKQVAGFIKLEGLHSTVNIYKKWADKEIMRTEGLYEPKFLDTIRDIEKSIQLTPEDKRLAEAQITNLISQKKL